jgi:hypothetical protein
MGNTGSKKSGTSMRVANPPNRNGNGAEWENFGNLFLDSDGRHGTLYLKATEEQIKELLKSVKDGKVEKRIGLFRAKPKADGAPALAAAA